jgi:hypothetical protein
MVGALRLRSAAAAGLETGHAALYFVPQTSLRARGERVRLRLELVPQVLVLRE